MTGDAGHRVVWMSEGISVRVSPIERSRAVAADCFGECGGGVVVGVSGVDSIFDLSDFPAEGWINHGVLNDA